MAKALNKLFILLISDVIKFCSAFGFHPGVFLLQGIFPACYVHLKEATVEGSGSVTVSFTFPFTRKITFLGVHRFVGWIIMNPSQDGSCSLSR